MKYDFIVIGATGMQGKIVTKDLVKNGHSVLMCGRDKSRIEHFLEKHEDYVDFAYLDLNDDEKAKEVIKNSGAKVGIKCAEGDWNFDVLKMFTEVGVHLIDLGSDIPLLKRQLAMHRELKIRNIIHITGCGSVPGIGNVMLNYADRKFDKIDTVEVGFAWDSNMKVFVVPFSIGSILEEFTMYAPFMHNHKMVRIKPTDSMVKAYHKSVGREEEFKCGHHPETYTFNRFCKKKGIKNIEFYAGFPDHSIQVT